MDALKRGLGKNGVGVPGEFLSINDSYLWGNERFNIEHLQNQMGNSPVRSNCRFRDSAGLFVMHRADMHCIWELGNS